jgi:lactate dehydrogenase-like 2-hydroxyacid dehydrogenase
MTHIVLTMRELPLPPFQAGGEDIEFRLFKLDEGMSDAAYAKAYGGAAALLSTSLEPVTAAHIARLPKSVGLIANLGVGFDTIDREAAKARGLVVTNTPVVAEDTADLTFGLILSLMRRINSNDAFLRADKWPANDPIIGSRVHGKRLGLIGFGDIGQGVARRAKGFNMKVSYWNRSPRRKAAKALGASRVEDLAQLLSQSDIISLHTAHTPQTHHILNAQTLQACKKGSVIINTGRGGLIDETALIAALKSGHISGAALDVFENEPHVRPAFKALENVVLTPHIGAVSEECRMEIVLRGMMNVIRFLEGGEGIDVVPPP